MDDNEIVSSVARAIATAFDRTSSVDARAAANFFIENVKAGDARILANTAFRLVKRDWPSEIRLHAFKMLQHLVRLRWEELTNTEQHNFSSLAVELMSEIANPCEEWPLKSQTAALVAEIVRRESLNSWQELHPSIITLSNVGPIQAELVLMMLRWLPEDITVHNDDLEGDRRRILLRRLSQSLPEILPLLYALLERHYGSAIMEAGRQQIEVAKLHSATVIAAVNAINAYAEWAPIPDLARCGIIQGCGYLLSSPDYHLHACEFFKLVSARKRSHDDASGFDSAMKKVFEILLNAAKDFLAKSISATCNETEFEYAEYICESLVSLGSTNLHCISDDGPFLSFYLEKMLCFFQHYKLALHYQSLLFWLSLLRDLISKSKGSMSANTNLVLESSTNDEKRKVLSFVTDDICIAILDISFLRMRKKEKVHPDFTPTFGSLELWSDDFDGKVDFSQYRSRLLDLIRFIGYEKPLVAAAKVSSRTSEVISTPSPSKDLAIIESMHLALENVVTSVFDGSIEYLKDRAEIWFSLNQIFNGLLQQMILLKWTEPTLVEVLGHYLDALGPFLRYYPDAVGSVINKLFELLTSLPCMVKDPSTSGARRARLQICTSFIRIAKGASESLLPCMKEIASTMTHLRDEGVLLRSEENLLGEAFLIMASSAGPQQQQEVLLWLLEPLCKQWTQSWWQESYLSHPVGLIQLCSETKLMWSMFHVVTFFEKALKRSGFRKGSLTSEIGSDVYPPTHPMASHLSWMLPPLLKLLRAIHSLWSPSITVSLHGEIKAAMTISDVEKSSLLGEGHHKLKGTLTFVDESQYEMGKDSSLEPKEADIRNWLRGIRDSGYSILGLSATLGDCFYRCIDAQSVVVALVENIEYMEFRHVKQLVHMSLIPIIKLCPPDLWEIWLEELLRPLFFHVTPTLTRAWSGLLQNGKAKVPDLQGVPEGSDIMEIMEEKLLRNLTREIGSLFSTLASPGLNTGLSSLDQTSPVGNTAGTSEVDLIGIVCHHRRSRSCLV